MKLYFVDHNYKYAVEQMLLTLFPDERPEYPDDLPHVCVYRVRVLYDPRRCPQEEHERFPRYGSRCILCDGIGDGARDPRGKSI